MSIDYYGTWMSAQIILPSTDGTRRTYELWFPNERSERDPELPAALIDLTYLTQISIQIGLALNSKIQVTLDMPREVGIELINSKLMAWAAAELHVQIGYSTGDSTSRERLTNQKFGGLMMKPDVRINGNGVTVTFQALGVAYGMNLSRATSPRTYKAGTTPWQAVKDTFAYNGIKTDNEEKIFPDFVDDASRNPTTAVHPFFKPVKRAVQNKSGFYELVELPINKGPRNDWWFVREIVKDYGLDLIIIDSFPIIRDPEKWKNEEPKRKFILGGVIDTERRQYPIMEFNSPSSYVWLGQGVGGAAMKDVSTDKKEAIEKAVTTAKIPLAQRKNPTEAEVFIENAEIATRSTLGGVATAGEQVFDVVFGDSFAKKAESIAATRTAAGAYNSGGTTRDAAEVFPGSPEDSRADQMESELRNRNHAMGIQAEISTIGIPSLLPSEVIEVDGLAYGQSTFNKGNGFNGKYGIMLVEHDIGPSGMVTKFKALMNAHFDEMKAGTTGSGIVNTSTVDESQSQDVVTKAPKGD